MLMHADACSRLPLPDAPASVPIPGDTILLITHLDSIPVKATQIDMWTQRDPVLATITKYVLQGSWPSKQPDDAQQPYFSRRDELSIESNCLLWGGTVIIPPQGQKLVLEELHVSHPGIEHMKWLPRSYVWWPGLDSDIEQEVKLCIPCQSNRKNADVCPNTSMGVATFPMVKGPHTPWSRVHIDYIGPFLGNMFLLLQQN